MQLHRLAGVFTVFVLVLGCNLMYSFAQTTVRPYKFGFTIEEQQHRSEKRDERGIVMGEFGFITADGIYHVTVYATDEEGKFHILAMRNYPYESPPKTINMIVVPKKSPSTSITTTTTTTTAKPKTAPTKHNFSNPACGGCFLTNNNEKPTVEEPARVVPKVTPPKKVPKMPLKIDIRTLAKELPLEPLTDEVNSITGNTNSSPGGSATNPAGPTTAKTQTGSNGIPLTVNILKTNNKPSTTTNTNTNLNGQNPSTGLLPPSDTPSSGTAAKPSGAATPKQQGSALNSNNNSRGSNKNVGGITGSGGLAGGVANAIAEGVKTIIGEPGDLYRFKYTLDYNGHTETGSRNGNKEGSYFSIGDDNIERTIEYVANEYGYHPRIRWRKLDTPVKAKENTLKDYEFVWFKKEQ